MSPPRSRPPPGALPDSDDAAKGKPKPPEQRKGHPALPADSLLQRAQTLLQRMGIGVSTPSSELKTVLQDLEMHQVELELQNEDLRQAQLELSESHDRLSDLYEFAPVAYMSLDRGTTIRRCNFAAAELLGLPRQNLVGKRFSTFLDRSEAERFHAHFHTARASSSRSTCEMDARKADRTPLRVRAEYWGALSSADADVDCHLALIDITAADRAETRLRELNEGLEQTIGDRTSELKDSMLNLQAQERQLNLALDAGRMGTWTVNVLDRRCFLDERLERLYGRAKLDGKTLDDWEAHLHPEDRDRMITLMERAMQGIDLSFSAEYRVVWPDGSVHWLVGRGQVLFDDNGRPIQVVGVKADADERKAIEMEMQQEVAREQRRIGQELHDDIQQRLTGLGLMAENLCETLASGSGVQLDTAHAVCSRLTREIGETSTRVNRLARGLVPLELESDGLAMALHGLARSIDAFGGQRKCVFSGTAGVAAQDRVAATHIFRIAQEAVTNAVRHSGATRIHIRLSGSRGCGILTVTDNGCGMQPHSRAGRGLQIMTYRASQIGATVKLGKARSGGTQVTCTFTIAGGGGGTR